MRVSGRFYIYVFKCVTAETAISPVHRAVFTTFKSGVRNKRKVDEALAFLSKKKKSCFFFLFQRRTTRLNHFVTAFVARFTSHPLSQKHVTVPLSRTRIVKGLAQ